MFKYETHLHTVESSACATSEGRLYPQYYKELGYDGIFITDHLALWNHRMDFTGKWEDCVDAFCLGYDHAKEAGDAIGFPVYFAWEANIDGTDFLVYGLDKEWLLAHPDMMSWNYTEYYHRVHEAGGLVVQAHPFRERDYIHEIKLYPGAFDAMEAYNAGHPSFQNHNAEVYCKENGIFMTAGSDLHKVDSLKKEYHFAMAFDTPIHSAREYAEAILSHKGSVVIPDTERANGTDIVANLPIVIRNPIL